MNAIKIKSKLTKFKGYCADNISSLLFFVIVLLIFSVILGLRGAQVIGYYTVELEEGFRNDGAIFFAVGKAMCHGMKPYVDMFESKGPMMFFTCAISYLCTENFHFVNIFSFICLFITFVCPLVLLVIKFIKNKNKNYFYFLGIFIAYLSFAFMLGIYLSSRAGRVYAEMYGSAFITLFFLCIYLINSEKCKLYSPLLILSSVFVMIGVLYKEPFVIIALIGSILICKSKKDFLYKFFLPFAYGAALGVIILAATGILPAYINIYLKNMVAVSGGGSSEYGNIFIRAFRVDLIINDFKSASLMPLLICITLAYVCTVFRIFKMPSLYKNEPTISLIARKLIYLLLSIIAVPFAVGTGSYLIQQFAFGVPMYCLFMFFSTEFIYDLKFKTKKGVTIQPKIVYPLLLCAICCVNINTVSAVSYEKRTYHEQLVMAKRHAVYVDEMLDTLHEDRYLFIGGIGRTFYAYTKHDALGPCFIQMISWFGNENNYFCKSFVNQLQKANVIFFVKDNLGAISEYSFDYIGKNFTTEQPQSISEIIPPFDFGCTTYFRNNYF